MQRRVGVFSHSTTTPGQGDWVAILPMTTSFINTYVDGAGRIIARVAKYGANQWRALLYNQTWSQWDVLPYSTVSGNAALTIGWDAWEEWNLANSWPTLPQLTSQNLLVQDNGTPYFVTSTYGSQCNQGTIFPYSKTMTNNFYNWSVGP